MHHLCIIAKHLLEITSKFLCTFKKEITTYSHLQVLPDMCRLANKYPKCLDIKNVNLFTKVKHFIYFLNV